MHDFPYDTFNYESPFHKVYMEEPPEEMDTENYMGALKKETQRAENIDAHVGEDTWYGSKYGGSDLEWESTKINNIINTDKQRMMRQLKMITDELQTLPSLLETINRIKHNFNIFKTKFRKRTQELDHFAQNRFLAMREDSEPGVGINDFEEDMIDDNLNGEVNETENDQNSLNDQLEDNDNHNETETESEKNKDSETKPESDRRRYHHQSRYLKKQMNYKVGY